MYLGTHMPNWLGLTTFPLFVSHRRLAGRRTFPRALTGWALDSGGFTELSLHGADAFADGPELYVEATYRYQEQIGHLDFAAPQDWMCEPFVTSKTGLTVRDHQHRTVQNLLELRALAPDLPFIPVLQGWTVDDYHRCVTLYAEAGIDLRSEPTVGVGSVCRRQDTSTADLIFSTLADAGLSLHGFGVKTTGLQSYAWALTSADSMAWSFRARHCPPMAGCTHKTCANCLQFATRWRSQVLKSCEYQQLTLGAAS